MTDLEMTQLCADAMGIKTKVHPIRGKIMRHWFMDRNLEREYNPLYDGSQALDLVKKCELFIMPEHEGLAWMVSDRDDHEQFQASDNDLNRAIVECVAKMQSVTTSNRKA